MSRAYEILSIALPIFLTIALGALCRRRGFVSPEGMRCARWIAVNLALPAVSMGTFARTDYSGGRALVPVWIVLVCFAALGLGHAAKRLLKLPGHLTPYLCTCFEGGMLGFTLYPLAYGDLGPFSIVVLGQTLFIFTFYKLLVSGRRGRQLLKEAVASPSIWAVTIGLILGAAGLYRRMGEGPRLVFDKTLSFLSAPTSMLILLTVGYDLSLGGIQWRRIAKVVAARWAIMALMLLATVLVNRHVLGGVMETSAMAMLFILPAPFVVTAFSREEDEAAFLSSTLSVMTLLSLAAFVAMCALLRG